MKLPNLQFAEVSKDKIAGYLLNPTHPAGADKAKFFTSLGYNVANWQLLADALRRVAEKSPITRTVESVHGQKYIIDGGIDLPSGRSVSVRTVWIIDHGAVAPRLVTAYPHDRGV